ncbi:hypothetical protein NDU88_003908 [Pleurodeles waltl]|uniref:Uncharacterized protein n=1 Tax=Pleurodeles waltl TaxID=8319 RepID=A0AAV7UZV5_PLEWA|nr:hypothetical protein NDU88_003908 [Pleurodeles waltl]
MAWNTRGSEWERWRCPEHTVSEPETRAEVQESAPLTSSGGPQVNRGRRAEPEPGLTRPDKDVEGSEASAQPAPKKRTGRRRREVFPGHRTRSGAAHTQLYFIVRGSLPRYEHEERRTFGNGRQQS